jgi:hypothetical protein
MSQHGYSRDAFKKFKHVYTGHYHTASTKDNITYLGTPYELTWSDYNDPKKVYLFDCNNGNIESSVLNKRMYIQIEWNEDLNSEWAENQFIDLREKYNVADGAYYKVIVKDPKHSNMVDSFVRWADKEYNASKISIIDLYNIVETDVDIDDIKIKNTLEMFNEYTSEFHNKNELMSLIKDVYEQALIDQINVTE